MCIPSFPAPFVGAMMASELGYRSGKSLTIAAEAALDKVVDFDGDKTTFAKAKKEFDSLKADVKLFAHSSGNVGEKVSLVAFAPIMAPIGALLAPIQHAIQD